MFSFDKAGTDKVDVADFLFQLFLEGPSLEMGVCTPFIFSPLDILKMYQGKNEFLKLLLLLFLIWMPVSSKKNWHH